MGPLKYDSLKDLDARRESESTVQCVCVCALVCVCVVRWCVCGVCVCVCVCSSVEGVYYCPLSEVSAVLVCEGDRWRTPCQTAEGQRSPRHTAAPRAWLAASPRQPINTQGEAQIGRAACRGRE